jgi:ribosomal-protein-alanine N-acetyltransferase
MSQYESQIFVDGDSLEIQPASWRDLGAVRELEKICFPKDSWPLLDMIGVLTLPGVVRLKAVLSDRIVGFIAGEKRLRKGLAWIATICVLPDYRRSGVARALLTHCEEILNCNKIRLSVRASNDAAIQLYTTMGYQQVSRWTRYYRGGEDAVIMEKT